MRRVLVSCVDFEATLTPFSEVSHALTTRLGLEFEPNHALRWRVELSARDLVKSRADNTTLHRSGDLVQMDQSELRMKTDT